VLQGVSLSPQRAKLSRETLREGDPSPPRGEVR
jgi:hypothetical protein